MQSFIIHMNGDERRAPNARRLLSLLPGAEIIEAVVGRDIFEGARGRIHPGTLYRPHYPFPLRPAELGVFESHRRCWQRIIDEGLDFALIVEDDLAIEPDRFGAALELVAAHATPGMYVRLPVKPREAPAQVLAAAGGMQLILPRVIGLQCICQVVGRDAAARLLALGPDIDRPVDTLIQMHWVTGQPVHALLGSGNREIAHELGGSTIQTKPPLLSKPRRELLRAWYRAQVALRPQRAQAAGSFVSRR